jgi:endonuclease-3
MTNVIKILKKMRKMINNENQSELTTLGKISKKNDPFRVLISTILSSRTKDETTYKATNRLFRKFRNAEELSKAPVRQIKQLIKPVGFYKKKSKKIKDVSHIIVHDYDSKVPNNIQNLVKLPLVGRKTANCVLVYAFNEPAIPVDVHVHRISNRLGIVDTKTPEETEKELLKIVQKKYWILINEYFVRFGQLICKPVNPKCNNCLLNKECPYVKNNL